MDDVRERPSWSSSARAELQRDGRNLDVGVLLAKNGDNPTGVLLQVVDNGQMPEGQGPSMSRPSLGVCSAKER